MTIRYGFLRPLKTINQQMSFSKRIGSVLFSFAFLLLANIARIVLMSELFMRNLFYYDALHMLTWYALSILIVLGIWFLAVWIFRINQIPVYTDFKTLIMSYKKIKKSSRKIHSSSHRLGYFYMKHQPSSGLRRKKKC